MSWQRTDPAESTLDPERYWNPYLVGALLGVLLFLVNFVTGHGLGASGGMARMVAVATDAVSPGSVNQNSFFIGLARPARVVLDHWLIWSIVGAVLGAMISGLIAGRFRPQVHRGPRISVPLRLSAALLGGIFMGYGSQWARGCTSGQALSGGAVLSVGSWAFMFSVFGGGYALAYFMRRLWR